MKLQVYLANMNVNMNSVCADLREIIYQSRAPIILISPAGLTKQIFRSITYSKSNSLSTSVDVRF